MRSAGRRAADSRVMRFLARAGLAARGVMYVIVGWLAVQVAFGHSRQQADRTGALHGLYLAYKAWRKEFRRDLELGRLRAPARRAVEWLGEFGGIARGIVFATAGVFLVIAAVDARPQQAKGVDSSLRTLAATPVGPWLLLAVAIGLIMFGVFSCCEAKLLRL